VEGWEVGLMQIKPAQGQVVLLSSTASFLIKIRHLRLKSAQFLMHTPSHSLNQSI